VQGNESRLTGLEGGHEIVGIPGCEFSLALDGLFAGHSADEVEGEMADHRHVCGAVAAAQARLVLLELNIENPVEPVLDAPVGSGGLGKGFRGLAT